MKATRSIRSAAALAAVMMTLLPAVSFAGWEESYKAGKAALESNRPGEAIKFLKEAIAAQEKEKAAAIKASGMFFEPYLPHFYLGMALFQRKEYKAAVDEFNTSERQRVIQKFKDQYARLQQTRGLAEEAAASAAPSKPPETAQVQPPQTSGQAAAPPPPAPPASGTGESGAATPAATTTGTVPKPADQGSSKPGSTTTAQPMTPPKPAGPDPALVQAINAAGLDIAAVGQLEAQSGKYIGETEKNHLETLVSEIRNASTAAAANSKHQELKAALAGLKTKVADRKKQEEAKVREEETRQAALSKNKALKDAMDRANPAIQEAESFASSSRGVLESGESQRLSSRIAAVKGAATPEAVNGAASALRTELASLKKNVAGRSSSVTKNVMQSYSTGVAAYYAGRYDDALPLLKEASAGLSKDPEAQVYLGSALYRKYLLGRSQDGSLKSQAEQAFQAALGIRRDYAPDPKTFPPKVVSLFREVAARR